MSSVRELVPYMFCVNLWLIIVKCQATQCNIFPSCHTCYICLRHPISINSFSFYFKYLLFFSFVIYFACFIAAVTELECLPDHTKFYFILLQVIVFSLCYSPYSMPFHKHDLEVGL